LNNDSQLNKFGQATAEQVKAISLLYIFLAQEQEESLQESKGTIGTALASTKFARNNSLNKSVFKKAQDPNLIEKLKKYPYKSFYNVIEKMLKMKPGNGAELFKVAFQKIALIYRDEVSKKNFKIPLDFNFVKVQNLGPDQDDDEQQDPEIKEPEQEDTESEQGQDNDQDTEQKEPEEEEKGDIGKKTFTKEKGNIETELTQFNTASFVQKPELYDKIFNFLDKYKQVALLDNTDVENPSKNIGKFNKKEIQKVEKRESGKDGNSSPDILLTFEKPAGKLGIEDIEDSLALLKFLKYDKTLDIKEVLTKKLQPIIEIYFKRIQNG